ncbi:MAG: cytochrome c oxidase subunit I [Chloroflexi bacterium]|nr:cytochrome c oxidase subunit I [Chloroflexota bacterium]MDA1283060.1 cytochrome c oxidase subunit I [Chloroflexota bacterium]
MTTKSLRMPQLFPRPKSSTGIWSWIGTVDHKRIGTLYGITSFIWFIVGGLEALMIRGQLASAENDLIGPETYNQLFTMHGTTMVFLVIMPLSAAFFNWLIPLQIGARDVAFPRLNALSFWVFLFGSLLINFSWITGNAPNGGWFGYAPLSGATFNPGLGMTYWVVGLNVLGLASIAAGLNFIVTILNMRAPGMSMFKIPIFTWMTLITSVLIVLAMPVLAVAGIQLMTDRVYGTHFFNSLGGGDPVMWQHIFWLFGHPEVYILILPAMGIVSEVLPTFARKPLFGYPFVVFAGAAIAFMGWFVWSHHMFTVGLGPAANTAFSISTMLIAVPTGVKIFNWLGTLWGGNIRLNTPMLFSISFIAMFTIGGLSGVIHASPPTDAQQQDTYFVVAHFHYVLVGGALLGIFSGIYYWWPKFTGYFLNEKLGIANWALMMIGFNLQFAPMHWLGMDGMPRRIYTYGENMGWETSNMAASIGGAILGLGILVFIINVFYSKMNKVMAGNDPWDGRTLEWSTSSPPPVHDFDEIPQVKYRDDFWFQKYPETIAEYHHDEHDQAVPSGAQLDEVEEALPVVSGGSYGHGDGHSAIHLPDMSYYPFILALGIAGLGAGFLSNNVVIAVGAVILVWGLIGWAMEPVNDPK